MSELTPERIRDAAEVIRTLNIDAGTTSQPYGTSDLYAYAAKLEREQAAEAKREKRAAELAEELRHAYCDGVGEERLGGWSGGWMSTARALLDRYPALLEGPES